MSHFPSELLGEVLVRVPAESLFRFRSVCKTWLGMIEDPSFIKAHTNNQLYSHTLLVRSQTGARLYSFSLDSLNFIKGPQKIDTTRVPALQQNLFLSASCNGLILINQVSILDKWTIWNPLTGECHHLPQPSGIKIFGSGLGFGFGYDRDADDYKVVRLNQVYSSDNFVYQTLVYSLKLKSWSKIEDCPLSTCDSRGTFWNGSLFWTSVGGIIALDLRTQSYCRLPLPQINVGSEFLSTNGYSFHLEALDGCLICSLNNCEKNLFDGWVMKDNGVDKLWTKLFSLRYPADNTSREFRLVAYFLAKQQVVMQCDWGFLWFDIDNDSVLKFTIHGIPHINSSRICPGSLVRLNPAVGLGVLQLKER